MFLIALGLMLAAYVEYLNIGAVTPLLAGILGDNSVDAFDQLKNQNHLIDLHVSSQISILLYFVFITLLSCIFRVAILWSVTKLSYGMAIDLAVRMYSAILHRPLEDFASESDGNSVNLLTRKVDILANQILLPLFIGLSHVILLVSILAAVLSISGESIYAVIVLAGAYYLMRNLTKFRLINNSKIISDTTTQSQSLLQESIRGIRQIRIQHKEKSHLNRYQSLEINNKNAQAQNIFISQAPKYLFETVAILALVTIAVVPQAVSSRNFSDLLPTVGMLLFAGQRVFPIIQRIFWAVTTFSGAGSILAEIVEQASKDTGALLPGDNGFGDILSINMKNICYKYPDAKKYALRGVNLNLRLGDHIAVVGRTGSGKSTLIDLMLGLINPTEGSVQINEQHFKRENIKAWHDNVALVSQDIDLNNTTLQNNIIDPSVFATVDYEKLLTVLKVAQLDEFIDSFGRIIDQNVGERGLMLSGGQRQRVALAAALYKGANFIFLDEPTSALDANTEAKLVAGLRCYLRGKTLILITHNSDISDMFEKKIVVQNGCVSFENVNSTENS